MAACGCGGQSFRIGRSAQSAGMCLGSIRRIFPLVQFQTPPSSWHSVIRCGSESSLAHLAQRSVFVMRLAARRSIVGIISCTTIYQVAFILSDSTGYWMLYHTFSHRISGYLVIIRVTGLPLSLSAIILRTLISRFRSPDRPARSQSVYRMSYPFHKETCRSKN
jgi:hypothetical protein